jgi:glycosyltransferase involved in cell wall biosynthesis
MNLSIGVPAYNQGNYLRATLESILRQNVPFHEIVVSNNHSTDSTAEVIAAVQQEHPDRIRLVAPPEHLTMAANWNFTASHLSGDWFSLISSDDLTLPNFAGSIQAAVAHSSNAVLVRGGWRLINKEGKPQGDHRLLSVTQVTKPPKTIYEQRFGPKGSFGAFALRRDIWERAGKFPEEVTLLGDWGMWLLAGALGDIVTIDDIIAAYRTGHQPGMDRDRQPIFIRETFMVYQQILPRATQLGGFGTPHWIAKASRKRFREMLIRTSKKFNADERMELIEALRPWAEATGETARFERFMRGKIFREFNLMKALHPLARRVVAALRRPAH